MGTFGTAGMLQIAGSLDGIIGLALANGFKLCGLTLPTKCGALPTSTVTVSLVLPNLKFSYASGNTTSASVYAAIEADFAAKLGVPVSAITISGVVQNTVNNATAGSKVTISISVDKTQSASIATALSTQLSAGAVSLPSLSTLPASSKESPAAGQTVDSSQSQATNGTPASGGGSVTGAASVLTSSISMTALFVLVAGVASRLF